MVHMVYAVHMVYVMLCYGMLCYAFSVAVHMVYVCIMYALWCTWFMRCTWFMLCYVMLCVQCCSARGLCVACALLFFARSAALAQWQSGIHTCPLRAVGPPPMPVRGQCGSPSALHRTSAVAMFSRSAPMHLCVTPCGKYTLVCDNMHALVCDTMRQVYSCVTPCTCV